MYRALPAPHALVYLKPCDRETTRGETEEDMPRCNWCKLEQGSQAGDDKDCGHEEHGPSQYPP